MSFEQGDERLVFRSEERATTPRDGDTVLADRWWIYVEGKGIFFYRQTPRSRHLIPQCNSNKDCAEVVRARLYPWATLKHFPVIYMPVDSEGRMG